MALRVVALVLTTPTARALTPPTRVLPGRRAVAVAAAPAALPTLAAACAVPTCLGFYKREYGVSYGYGLSIVEDCVESKSSPSTRTRHTG